MVHHNSKHSQLKYVNDILFVLFIIVFAEFSGNFNLQTKAVQLQPALRIVFLL